MKYFLPILIVSLIMVSIVSAKLGFNNPNIPFIKYAKSVDNIYGEMWYNNRSGLPLEYSEPNTWYPLLFTNAGKLNGFIFIGNSNLTAGVNGLYKACYIASGSGINNHEYITSILINGVEQEKCSSYKKMAASGDVISMNGCCLIDLVVNDNIQVATMDYGGTGNVVYHSANLNLIRIEK